MAEFTCQVGVCFWILVVSCHKMTLITKITGMPLGPDKKTYDNLMIPWQSSPGRLVVVGEGGTEILRWQQQLAWACCLFTLSIYMNTIYYLLFTIYYLLSTIYYLLFTIYYLLSTIYHLLLTIYYLPSTIYHLLFTIYFLLVQLSTVQSTQ